MSSVSDVPRTEDADRLPSYDALRRTNRPITLSPEAKRVFWSLNGALSNSIWIMADAYSPTSLKPYVQQSMGVDTIWHPASPLIEPKISSVTVRVFDLDEWEDQWFDLHRDHSVPGVCEGPEDCWTTYGPLPDYNPEEDEEGPQHLLVCCGTQRPRGKAVDLLVKSSLSLGREFVTLHDYLSAVHPWLLSLREDILEAMGSAEDTIIPAETKLMVDFTVPDSLKI